jgi:hypothetical protein
MGTCKECRWWMQNRPYPHQVETLMRLCANHVQGSLAEPFSEETSIFVRDDEATEWTRKADFYSGPRFGCSDFQPWAKVIQVPEGAV